MMINFAYPRVRTWPPSYPLIKGRSNHALYWFLQFTSTCQSEPFCLKVMVRKLKGKEKKETGEQKRQRRTEIRAAREKLTTVVIPVLLGVVLLIALVFWFASR